MVGLTGIGSGIDIDSIVGALVSAEKAPKEAQLARLEKATTTKFSALGQLKSSLSAFQTALKELNDTSLFEKRTASSSNTASLTASASKSALAGIYQVAVNRLAASSKVASAAVDNTFGSGAAEEIFTVKLGAGDTGTQVKITAGSDLSSTRDQLNAALKDKGISVNIVSNPGSTTGESRLVFSSSKTGAGQDVIVTGTGNLAALNANGAVALNAADTASAGYITQAADAEFSIDGLTLTSPTNSVTGAIPEVTLELVAKTEVDKTLTVTVGQDTGGVTDSIKKFVDAYNKLIKTSNELTSVVSVGEGKEPVVGGLVGDTTVRNLLSAVRNELVNPANQDGVRVLSDLGITTQKDGTLKINDDKLKSALKNNFDAVGTFFTGESGLMSRIDKRIDGFVKTGGVLEQRISGLQSTIDDIDKQKENLTLRIEKVQARLYAQFNAMDALVGQLNQTSDRLTQSLASLPGFVKKDS
ncbi:flagellar filament capping protein FliD [Pseudomonas sp. R-28-1W-6]|uniref:flagellar filament capping protein FliD n=1 Tax=Pseudomonas sp. R-28-1W-6 TaxID=2650101 RepID=UPI0013652FE5|nr:flagellar filament capping protein FliD [Pseudomonas sp. R-28-1W-6]MWV12563.1 flagellar filament capping protein FliD [Pseudomonas sp. R-28-1W-6]